MLQPAEVGDARSAVGVVAQRHEPADGAAARCAQHEGIRHGTGVSPAPTTAPTSGSRSSARAKRVRRPSSAATRGARSTTSVGAIMPGVKPRDASAAARRGAAPLPRPLIGVSARSRRERPKLAAPSAARASTAAGTATARRLVARRQPVPDRIADPVRQRIALPAQARPEEACGRAGASGPGRA